MVLLILRFMHILPRGTVLVSLLALVRGLDTTGSHEVAADAPTAGRYGHAVHETYLSGFSGGVAFLIRIGACRAEGADVYYWDKLLTIRKQRC
jgi:hypothetical protein